ncbi:MAG: hypothetical protein GY937_07030 [bacterium]|nr:hypothetical protein [bacterium]
MSTRSDPYIDLLKKCLTASLYEESAWKVIEGAPRADQISLRSPVKFLKGRLRRLLVRSFKRRSMMLVKRRAFDPVLRAEGRDWPCFGYTMAGHRRLENVQACVDDVLKNEVPGDFIETG